MHDLFLGSIDRLGLILGNFDISTWINLSVIAEDYSIHTDLKLFGSALGSRENVDFVTSSSIEFGDSDTLKTILVPNSKDGRNPAD